MLVVIDLQVIMFKTLPFSINYIYGKLKLAVFQLKKKTASSSNRECGIINLLFLFTLKRHDA